MGAALGCIGPSLHHKKPSQNSLQRPNPPGEQATRHAPAWKKEQPQLTDDGVNSDGELCAQDQGWPSPLPKVGETPCECLQWDHCSPQHSHTQGVPASWPRRAQAPHMPHLTSS